MCIEDVRNGRACGFAYTEGSQSVVGWRMILGPSPNRVSLDIQASTDAQTLIVMSDKIPVAGPQTGVQSPNPYQFHRDIWHHGSGIQRPVWLYSPGVAVTWFAEEGILAAQ